MRHTKNNLKNNDIHEKSNKQILISAMATSYKIKKKQIECDTLKVEMKFIYNFFSL